MTLASRNKTGPRNGNGLVPMAAIQQVADRIVERFQPDRIILFGSYAHGRPTPDSDVDLLVVMPARNEMSQACRILDRVRRPFSLDLLVRTPENLRWRLAEGDWFLQEAVGKGRVLYRKKRSRNGASVRPNHREVENLDIGTKERQVPVDENFYLEGPMKRLTAEWVKKAEADLRIGRTVLPLGSDMLDGVCFHSQQTIEKYLKALLQEKDITPPRTHDLKKLLDLLLPRFPALRRLHRGLDKLTEYAVDYRYPGIHATTREARTALRRAEEVRREIRRRLKLSVREVRQRSQ